MMMAAVSATKIASLILIVLLSFLFGHMIIMHNPPFADDRPSCVFKNGLGSVRATKNPTNSLLHAASRKVLRKYSRHETAVVLKKNREMTWVGSQLRNVPSGPDPLHHNRGTTKKPKTTP